MSTAESQFSLAPLRSGAGGPSVGTRFALSDEWSGEIRFEGDAGRLTVLQPGNESTLLSLSKEQTSGYYRLLYRLPPEVAREATGKIWTFTATATNAKLLNWVALLQEHASGQREFLTRGEHRHAAADDDAGIISASLPLSAAAETSHAVYIALQLSNEPGQFTIVANRVRNPAATADGQGTPQARSRNFAGRIERFEKFALHGWAADRDDPQSTVQVEILVDGETVGLCEADLLRKDLEKAGLGNGRHGFMFQLPEWVREKWIGDTAIHAVSAVIPSGPHELTGSPLPVSLKVDAAYFVDRATASLVGWARWRGALDSDLRLSLLIDGQRVAGTRADRPVRGFGGAKTPGGQCGFAFTVPDAFLDNQWHAADIVEATTGKSLSQGPITFRLTRPKVEVKLVATNGRLLVGEARDPAHPGAPVTLYLRINGRDFGVITANKSRAGLAAPGDNGRSAQGFTLPLPGHLVGQSARIEFSLTPEPEFHPVAEWHIAWTQGVGHVRRDPMGEISQAVLADDSIVAEIARAFQESFRRGGLRIDDRWYRLTYAEADEAIRNGLYADATAYYLAVGMAAGHSPGSAFDEMAYRRQHPLVQQAVDHGRLPCGYAHFLYTQGHGLGAEASDRHAEAAALYDKLATFWHSNTAFAVARTLRPNPPARADLVPRSGHNVQQPFVFDASTFYGQSIERLLASPAVSAEDRNKIGSSDKAAFHEALLSPTGPQPLVSIIMPTFNRAYTIAEAVQSVLDQSYLNWELLICDDGSFDKTSQVVAQFEDRRIRYMQFEKSNGAATRNKGLRFAQGEFIAYLDSDNLWHPLFLEVMIGRLRDKPWVPIAFAGYIDTEIIGTKIDLQGLKAPAFDPVKLSQRNFIDLNTLVHRAELTAWMGAFDKHLPRQQDWDLALRYSSIFFPLAVPYYLAFYRRNVAWGQVTHLFGHEDIQSIVRGKIQNRLDHGHATLDIPWSRTPSLALIADGSPQSIAVARTIVALLADTATLRVYLPRQTLSMIDIAQTFDGMPVRPFGPAGGRMTADRLATQLVPVINEETILACLIDHALQSAIDDALGDRVLHVLTSGPDGIAIAAPRKPAVHYHLGALPLAMAAPSAMAPDARPDVLVLHVADRTATAQIAKALEAPEFAGLRVAVTGEDPYLDPWTTVGRSDSGQALATPAAPSLEGVEFVVVTTPISQLPPVKFTFVVNALAHGKLLMTPASDLGAQWISVNAAFAIQRDEWPWILDKVVKLRRDDKTAVQLKDNARTVYQLVFHPELAKERLKYFLAQA